MLHFFEEIETSFDKVFQFLSCSNDNIVNDLKNIFLSLSFGENIVFYRQKYDTFIRNYDGIGYITNKSSFVDLVSNDSGCIFLSALSRFPQTLEQLVEKIIISFSDVSKEIVMTDAKEFYDNLVKDGFLVKGETIEECDRNDKRFSYAQFKPKTIKEDFSPIIKRADTTTQEYLEKHFLDKPHLTQFQIELTSKCNERCVHCYIPHECKLDSISDELYYKTLEELSNMGVLDLTLSGGEPMMHPNFKEYLLAAKNYDFSVNVLSNLTLLTDDIVDAMKSLRLSSVSVSLYSMVPEHHDSITKVSGSWKKTVASIEKLIANDIPLQVNCPTMKQNKDDFADVLKWCNKRKVRANTDYIMMAKYNHDCSNLEYRLSLDEVADVIKSVTFDNKDYQRIVLSPDFVEQCERMEIDKNSRVCGVGVSACCMVANGNVYPCAGWQDYICGNLTKTSLKDIWENSPKMKWLRERRRGDFKECINCEDRAFCAMCMVRNANESPTGNPMEINRHFCAIAALNKKIVFDWRNEMLKKRGNE